MTPHELKRTDVYFSPECNCGGYKLFQVGIHESHSPLAGVIAKSSIVELTHTKACRNKHSVDPELPAFRGWRWSGKVVGLHDGTI